MVLVLKLLLARTSYPPRHTDHDSLAPPLQIVDPVLSTAAQIGNANLTAGSESSVHALPPNEKGFYDVAGNAWEW